MKYLTLCWILFSSFVTLAQEPQEKTALDHINNEIENPFETESDITGQCFLILADDFNHYKQSVVIKGTKGNEVLRISYTDSIGLLTTYKGKTYEQFDTSNAFKPWLFLDNPDYFRLAFECVDTIGATYKVRLNETDVAQIEKKDGNFKKQSISDFVKNWTSFGFDFDRTTNPIRESPKPNAKIIIHAEQQKYKIWTGERLEIKGDWMKIKTIKNEVGWVRWRENKKVLIRMYYAC